MRKTKTTADKEKNKDPPGEGVVPIERGSGELLRRGLESLGTKFSKVVDVLGEGWNDSSLMIALDLSFFFFLND